MFQSNKILNSNNQIDKTKESHPENSNPKKETLRRKIKNLFSEWCQSSTSHGIPNIARTDNLAIRLMWIIAFLCSSGYCCLLLIQTFIEFFPTLSW